MQAEGRRNRLEQLLELARTYKGWTRRQLATALGRDTTKLVPESGLPKLDLLMDLAQVLDWPVDDVAQYVWAGRPEEHIADGEEPDFDTLQTQSIAAHRAGQYNEAVRLARRAGQAAQGSEERAIACNREASGWDGLGRYAKELEVAQRGLQESGVTCDRRLTLQCNLATAYYAQWHLVEATALAQSLISRYDIDAPTNRLNRVVHAFAHYLRGHCYRRLIAVEPQDAERHARSAKRDLVASREFYLQLFDEFDDEAYRGIANTCSGGIVEVDARLGATSPAEALEIFESALNDLVDPADYPVGDCLESYGWWCIFGCNVALRDLKDPKELQRVMALFTNKADEIAKHLDNWALRERVFTMDYARREQFQDWTGVQSDWTIDKDDVKLITGAIGSVPNLPTNWLEHIAVGQARRR